jgi:hypothetical protein
VLLPRQQAKLARGTKDKERAMSQTSNTAIAVIGIDIGKNSFHACRLLTGHRPSSHRCAAFNSRRATNSVALPEDRSYTPTHATMVRRKRVRDLLI